MFAAKKASDECAALQQKLKSFESERLSSAMDLQLCREGCAALKAKILAAAETSEGADGSTLKAAIQALAEEISALKAGLEMSKDENSSLMAKLQTHEEEDARVQLAAPATHHVKSQRLRSFLGWSPGSSKGSARRLTSSNAGGPMRIHCTEVSVALRKHDIPLLQRFLSEVSTDSEYDEYPKKSK